jgi:hypothetical protein
MGNGSSEAQEKVPPPGAQGLIAAQRFDISQGPSASGCFF